MPDKNISEKKKTASLLELIPSTQTGITFKNVVEEKMETLFEYFLYVYNGGGVAVGDINNDGLVDIYFSANETSNKLYLNRGDFTFDDITIDAGVAGSSSWTNGVSMVDINHDGFLDIYVCLGGWQDTPFERENLLFINNGDLTFSESAKEYGLNDSGYSIQVSFFDLDNDNDLDMYLINRPDTFNLTVEQYAERKLNPPNDCRDKLYINENGVFSEESKSRGLGQNYGHGLGIITSDINNDGFTDIFITNDFEGEDYLYMNQGNGVFKERIKESTNHISYNSMGIDIADLNNDGFEEAVTLEMRPSDYVRSKTSMPAMSTELYNDIIDGGMQKQFMHNMLLLNNGNSFFNDISQYAGISETDWSWSVLSSDLDNDGLRDLFITNGMRRDIAERDVEYRISKYVESNKKNFNSKKEAETKGLTDIINLYKPIKERNYLFQNSGNLKFSEVSEKWGFRSRSFSNGAAVADLDNDGDLDVIVNNLEDEAYIFKNNASELNNFLSINLNGPSKNKNGLGAKLWVFHAGKTQYFENKTVRGYLSSSDPKIHFGLNQDNTVDSILVKWPDGKYTFSKNIKANQLISMNYSSSSEENRLKEASKPIFNSATIKMISKPMIHQENSFDEYQEQILLPHMFSKNGPFISTGDLNGDNEEDFFIGGASGQSGQVYLSKNSHYTRASSNLLEKDRSYEDMGCSLVDLDKDGDLDLVVASGGSEFTIGSKYYQTRIYYNNGKGHFNKRDFLPVAFSSSCVVPEDIDHDGDIDLFIGGQVIANEYLTPPKSYFFMNENGQFENKTRTIAPEFDTLGMVYSATWADLNQDNQKEFIVVGEWMPITIYEYRQDVLENVSGKYLGDLKTEGWWNTVQANDIDQDGDLDLILGNLGENYKFHASEKKPFEVFAGDFDKNGTHDIFLAKNLDYRKVPIRGKECTSQQLPQIGEKYETFEAFAFADITEIIGTEVEKARHKKAHLFSSIILENLGDQFVLRKLPKEAQYSTVQTMLISDFNNDGIKDLLLAGNNLDVEIETTPADASVGYLLLGEGKLSFKAVPINQSGFFIPQNVKDMKLIDQGDRKGVLIAINNEQMEFFEINQQ
ncbi:MAG: VCBS repeat-containing protein [Reichenbachiella sp.]